MKYIYRTKNYIVEKDENLILHPLLSNKKIKNPFKHYEVRKKYYLILNEPLPHSKNFGKKKVKYPQTKSQHIKLLQKNFPVIKDMDFNLKRFLCDKEYRQEFRNNKNYIPATKSEKAEKIIDYAKTIKNFVKVVFVNAAIVVGIYFSINYGPGLYNSIENYIVSRLRPDSKEAAEFDPIKDIVDNKINTDIGNTKEEDKTIPSIQIDQNCMTSYDLLKNSNISSTLQLYLGDDRAVTPLFVYPSEENEYKTISIFCKIGEDEMVKLEYDISGSLAEYYYNSLFYSSTISPSDIINSLSNLASDEYLTDMPIISKIINIEGSICATINDLKKDVKYNIIDNEFFEQEIYSFKILSLQNNGNIIENHYEITKENAQQLENFDSENLGTILDAFKNDNSKFELVASFDFGYNAPTLVLVNAQRQEQSSTQIPNNNNDKSNEDLSL